MIRPIVLGSLLLLFVMPLCARAEETVCIQCHGSQPGRLGAPVEAWRGSIHAENANSCHGCHGGDPTDFANAMSPERGFIGVPADEDIPAFCGRCHVGVLENYKQSAHGQALGAGGPQCVTCHGNHAVKKASLALINKEDCSRCHEYQRAEQMRAALVETEGIIHALDGAIAALYRVGISTNELEGALFAERNRFHRLFHSVDVDKIRQQSAAVQSELGKVRQHISDIEQELQMRKRVGAVVIALLVLGGIVALLIRKTYEEEE